MSEMLRCVECGSEFDAPPYRRASAKYCSDACQKRGSGKARRGKDSVSASGRERIRAAVKRAHKLGRCAPSVSEAANVKRAASMKEAYASGRAPKFTEARSQAAIELGKRMRGRTIPQGAKSAAGPSHFNAKFWLLRTPDRNILIGPNLNEIIRRHAHLFDPGDVTKKTGKSRARSGLSGLFEIRRRNGQTYVMQSWKGWTALNKAEMVKDVGVPFDRLKFKPNLP